MFRQFKDSLKLTFRWLTLRIKAGPLTGLRWIAWSGKRFLAGTYEPCKTAAVVRSVKPGQTTFDVGGHVGYYAIIQAQLAGPQGHVYVFEPRPLNISYIKQHIRINNIDNITLIESAVSDKSGVSQFESRVGTGTGHLSREGNLRVKTIVIDALIEDGYPAPDFLKIDVEGSEIAVLNGARKTIADHRPKLLVATHGDTEHEFVLNFLKQHQYQHEILNENATKGDTEILAWQGGDA